MQMEKIGIFTVCQFLAKNLPQLNIKAAHNLKTKSLGIILTRWAMFVPSFTFLRFLIFEIMCGEECVHFWLSWPIFAVFANFATINIFSRNLSTHIILVLDATFLLHLMFLSLLSPEISFAEKTAMTLTHQA